MNGKIILATAILFVLISACPAFAENKTKSSFCEQFGINDQFLFEDFEKGTTELWTKNIKGAGTVSIGPGSLGIEGTSLLDVSLDENSKSDIIYNRNVGLGWANYTISFYVLFNTESSSSVGAFYVLSQSYSNFDNSYALFISPFDNKIQLVSFVGGNPLVLASSDYQIETGKEYKAEIDLKGSSITVLFDNKALFNVKDDTFSAGTIGFGAVTGSARGVSLRFDNILVHDFIEGTKSSRAGSTKTCWFDSDCRSGEECSGIPLISRYCKRKTGCWSSFQCADNQKCSGSLLGLGKCTSVSCRSGKIVLHKCMPVCFSDGDCSRTETCMNIAGVGGVCRPRLTNGGCTADSACDTDEQCFAGMCLPVLCPGGSAIGHQCVQGKTCILDNDCPTTQRCEGFVPFITRRCEQIVCDYGTINDHECQKMRCWFDSDCASDAHCVDRNLILHGYCERKPTESAAADGVKEFSLDVSKFSQDAIDANGPVDTWCSVFHGCGNGLKCVYEAKTGSIFAKMWGETIGHCADESAPDPNSCSYIHWCPEGKECKRDNVWSGSGHCVSKNGDNSSNSSNSEQAVLCTIDADCGLEQICNETKVCGFPTKIDQVKKSVLLVSAKSLERTEALNSTLKKYRQTLQQEGYSSFYLNIDSEQTQKIFGTKAPSLSDWKSVRTELRNIILKVDPTFVVILGGVSVIPMPITEVSISAPNGISTAASDDLFVDTNFDRIPKKIIARIPTPSAENVAPIINSLEAAVAIRNNSLETKELFAGACGEGNPDVPCNRQSKTEEISSSLFKTTCEKSGNCHLAPPYCTDSRFGTKCDNSKDVISSFSSSDMIFIFTHGNPTEFGDYDIEKRKEHQFLKTSSLTDKLDSMPRILTSACFAGCIDNAEKMCNNRESSAFSFLSKSVPLYIANTRYGLRFSSPDRILSILSASDTTTVGQAFLSMKTTNLNQVYSSKTPDDYKLFTTYEVQLYGDPTLKLEVIR